jgi:hypothetical protein
MILNFHTGMILNLGDCSWTWLNMNMNVHERFERSRTMFTHELFNDRDFTKRFHILSIPKIDNFFDR